MTLNGVERSTSPADWPRVHPLFASWLDGGWRTFALLMCFGAAALVFAFATVFYGRDLAAQSGPSGCRTIIAYWQQHGYIHTGGLIHLPAPWRASGSREIFWRSSTGAYLATGYLLEQFVRLVTGQYSYRALAIHNAIVALLTAVLLGLLAFRLLVVAGVDRFTALVLSVGCELVTFSFPDSLACYWAMVPQAMAMPFALLFLLFDREQPRRRDLMIQGMSAFALLYSEYVYGLLFFLTYTLLRLFVDRRMIRWRRLAAVTVIPAAAAFALFALQLTLNRAHYPQIPLEGSGFLVRSGLDGSAAYYGEHGDLIYGRSVARQNFPANRPYLFTWRWLFIAGCASMGIITAAGVKHRTMRPVLIALGALVGAYALYAAVFSQAVVIHPYQYDYLLAVPFIALTFAFVPGLIEISLTTRGITAAIVILVACWYAMVEMRNYALRYPLVTPSTSTTGTQSKFGELNSAGEWLPMAYASTNFATDVGSVEVGAADQAVFRYSVIGRTMLMSVSLQSLTAAGNPREIRIAIPDGRVVVAGTGGAALVNNNGAWAVSRYYANSDSRYIAVLPAVSGGTFSTCRRCIYLHFTAMFEIK